MPTINVELLPTTKCRMTASQESKCVVTGLRVGHSKWETRATLSEKESAKEPARDASLKALIRAALALAVSYPHPIQR